MTKNELQEVQGGMIILPFRPLFTKTINIVYRVMKFILR